MKYFVFGLKINTLLANLIHSNAHECMYGAPERALKLHMKGCTRINECKLIKMQHKLL